MSAARLHLPLGHLSVLLVLPLACQVPKSAPTIQAPVEWTLDPESEDVLAGGVRAELLEVMVEYFGTPARPHYAELDAWRKDGFDPNRDWDEAVTFFGAVCRRCHGAVGAGDGPRAGRLFPRPRDYRLGLFKFSAVASPSRPRLEDVTRTLEHGLPGTAMPSFKRLEGEQRMRLAEYVRLLSMRGELERWCVADWEMNGIAPRESAAEAYGELWQRWRTADQAFVGFGDEIPAGTPELIAWGDELFHAVDGANCVRCHGQEGRGDGPAVWETNADGQRVAALKDDWGHYTVPRDLTRDAFRGGREPLDVYRRLACGIHGTPMPAFASDTENPAAVVLDGEALWALAYYALSLAENP